MGSSQTRNRPAIARPPAVAHPNGAVALLSITTDATAVLVMPREDEPPKHNAPQEQHRLQVPQWISQPRCQIEPGIARHGRKQCRYSADLSTSGFPANAWRRYPASRLAMAQASAPG